MPIDLEAQVISFSTLSKLSGFYQGRLDRAEQFIYIYNDRRYLVSVARILTDPDKRYIGIVLTIVIELGVNSDTAIDS
jgi:hypothetical protein